VAASGTITFDFHGKVAVVTGSSRHLGATIARTLGACGAQVAVHYARQAEEANRVVGEIRDAGGVAEAFQADATDADALRRMAAAVLERFGRVDILVNNVGPYADLPFASMPEEVWDRVMDSCVKAAYLLTQSFAPGMRDRGWGRIVNISAGSAFIRTHSVYGLAKAAIIHLTESLAVELAPQIRVNAIAPGQIQDSEEIDRIDPTYKTRLAEATPLRRLVTRAEIAQAVCLLSSDLFPSLTGHTLVLDGGWSIPVGRDTPVLGMNV